MDVDQQVYNKNTMSREDTRIKEENNKTRERGTKNPFPYPYYYCFS